MSILNWPVGPETATNEDPGMNTSAPLKSALPLQTDNCPVMLPAFALPPGGP